MLRYVVVFDMKPSYDISFWVGGASEISAFNISLGIQCRLSFC